MYIHQRKDWTKFTWDAEVVTPLLGAVRYKQGKILGAMLGLGFQLQEETVLKTLTLDVIKSSEIEGELLNPDQVRSSIARRLGIEIAGAVPTDRNVEGVVEMLLDATQRFDETLTEARLFGWHGGRPPRATRCTYTTKTRAWRDDAMQLTSGPVNRQQKVY